MPAGLTMTRVSPSCTSRHLSTWCATGFLQRHNIKFILEGEEEIGSPSLAKWAEEHKDLLACDIMLVSDTTMIGEDVPSINCGMRGLTYMEIEVTGPNKDLHSGHYGGAVVNPLNALCKIMPCAR